jgi:glycosyltransferase involved in cell wall biosynthesis
VVIPAKDEAGGIGAIVDRARHHAEEVIVVDGCSVDGTRRMAASAGAIIVEDGKGKGAGYLAGLRRATGDGSHDPGDIPRLVAPIRDDRAELVIASRFRGGSDEWEGDVDTYLRHLGGGVLTLAINWRWGTRLTECLNGFRALKREVGLAVPLRTLDFDVEQHMVCQFLRHGHRVTEVGCHEYRRGWGRSKLPTYRKALLFFWRLGLDLLPRPHRPPREDA